MAPNLSVTLHQLEVLKPKGAHPRTWQLRRSLEGVRQHCCLPELCWYCAWAVAQASGQPGWKQQQQRLRQLVPA
eukprot:914046-Pelagomonas_calceolata.AAC.4